MFFNLPLIDFSITFMFDLGYTITVVLLIVHVLVNLVSVLLIVKVSVTEL